MSAPASPDHHGDSPAAWTAVVIMLVGFAVGTIAYWFAVVPVVFIGVALIVIGLIVGIVMSKLGFGVNGPKYSPKAHS